jgi:hypothetical protein
MINYSFQKQTLKMKMKGTTTTALLMLSSHHSILFLFITVVGLSSLVNAQSCLKSAGFRSIFPSVVDPSRIPPSISVHGNVFSSDAPHLVLTSSSMMVMTSQQQHQQQQQQQQGGKSMNDSSKDDYSAIGTSNFDFLRVMLPGTTDSPEKVSCLLASLAESVTTTTISSSSGSSSRRRPPVIGLSYAFLNSPDVARNQGCREQSSVNMRQQQCLAQQHEDAIWGSSSENASFEPCHDLWQTIQYEDSIVGRLTMLLEYLEATFPTEGWGTYLTTERTTSSSSNDDNNNNSTRQRRRPNWGRIWIMGHSQGAGHAAYLAHSVSLAGAGLLSGPQDEDDYSTNNNTNNSNNDAWMDQPFATKSLRAMSHVEEGAIETIQNNWRRMEPFRQQGGNNEDAFVLDTTDLLLLDDDGNKKAEATMMTFPTNRPWITTVAPQPDATYPRPEHCSTALNDNAPLVPHMPFLVDGKEHVSSSDGRYDYLYAKSVWPQLAGILPLDERDAHASSSSSSSNRKRNKSVATSPGINVGIIAALLLLITNEPFSW